MASVCSIRVEDAEDGVGIGCGNSAAQVKEPTSPSMSSARPLTSACCAWKRRTAAAIAASKTPSLNGP